MIEPAGFDSSELSFLAFRYISGELTAQEALEFETRLSEDQSAREAVAEMVELSAAVHFACENELPKFSEATPVGKSASTVDSARSSRLPVRWILGLAVALCLSFCLGFFSRPDRQIADRNPSPIVTPEVETRTPSASPEEALDVLQAFNTIPRTDNLDELIAGIDPETGRLLDSADVSDAPSSEEESFDVPAWMFAAVDELSLEDSDPLQPQPEKIIQEN